MRFFSRLNPVGGLRDFAHEFTRPTPYRWPIIAVSAAITVGIFSVMWQEEVKGLPPRPELTYITSWRADRSDAEIIAGNIANQQRKDAEAAAEAQRQADIRDMYKTLGRMSGMDVDRIEREAAADRAAEAKAAATRQAELRASATRTAAETSVAAPAR